MFLLRQCLYLQKTLASCIDKSGPNSANFLTPTRIIPTKIEIKITYYQTENQAKSLWKTNLVLLVWLCIIPSSQTVQ